MNFPTNISLTDPRLIWTVLCAPVLYLTGLAIYRLYFHPLSRFPGPLFFKLSRIPYFCRVLNGTFLFEMLDLHEKYGDIVRIAPDELAFSHPDAWNDIMGHKKGGHEFTKAEWFYLPIEGVPRNLVSEPRERHGQLRRQFAHGFSEKAMRGQESLIQGYVDTLMHRLHQQSESRNKAPVEISEWFYYCTFDIIGDLAFGEPFGCLEKGEYDPWIKAIFESGRFATILQALGLFPPLRRLLLRMIPESVKSVHEDNRRRTEAKLKRRMERPPGRPDLIEGMLTNRDELKLGMPELLANGELLIIGGSETTATLLSVATYLLCTHPDVMTKVVKEVRDTFQNEAEITLLSVSRLEYMLAVLNECLRLYPPIANGLPRVVPQGGAKVMGQYIAGDTNVAVHHWALYHREDYFKDAHGFHPERFLGDERYANDRRDALQPFSFGPRNCIGRNLAYAEMRLILARTLYNFDMRLADESRGWFKEQRNFLQWEKGTLKVHLTPVGEGQ